MGRLSRACYLMLALALGTACHPVHANTADRILQSAVGASPAQAFHLPQALRRLGLTAEASHLERYMVHAFVAEAGGQAHDVSITVRQAVAAGQTLQPPEQSENLRMRWAATLNTNVEVVLAATPRPLPAELGADTRSLVELAPGFWALSSNGRLQRLYLLVNLSTSVPMPLNEFRLELLPKAHSAGQPFTCRAEAGNTLAVIAPGRPAGFLCRALSLEPITLSLGPAVLLARASAQGGLIRIASGDLANARAVEAMAMALAAPRAAELERLVPVHVVTSVPAGSEVASTQRASAGRTGAPALPAKDGAGGVFALPAELPGTGILLLVAGCVLAGYCGLAKVTGNRSAAFLAWFLATAMAGIQIVNGPTMFTGNWDGLLIAIMHALSLVAPVVIAFLLYVGYEVVERLMEMAQG